MLAKVIKSFKDYTNTREFGAEGELFTVFAIQRFNDEVEYAVLPLGAKSDSGEYDPLFFEADNFEVIADEISKDWVTKAIEPPEASFKTTVTSFPEWFENGFGIRAHDWSLAGDDYKVINKYKKLYEDRYKEYLISKRLDLH